MDRNSIIGILIIAAILVVWGIVNKPSSEELEKARKRNDSIALSKEIAQKEAELQKLKQQSGQLPPTEYQAEEAVEPVPAAEEVIDYKKIVLENNLIRIILSEKGGRPVAVELKNYMRYDSLPIILFDEDSSRFGLQYFSNNRPFHTNDLLFQALTDKDTIRIEKEPESVAMRYTQEEGKYIEFRYRLTPDRYLVTMEMEFVGMENISTQRTGIIDLDWMINSPQQERGRDNEMIYTTLYFKPLYDDVDYLNARSKKQIQSENLQTRVEWIAYKDQFFSSVILARDAFLDANMQSELKPRSSKYLKKFESTIGLAYDNSGNYQTELDFYFGPNKYKLLKKQYGDKRLQDLVTVGRGLIKWINQIIIINLFDFLNKFISNYGIIILIMTIIIKVILLPLTYKSYMSTAKMKVLKPQIDEINKRIPKEKAMERQQATMALYKKVGVSPLGGCLPMLLQMPILFAMFRFFPTSIELRQQGFLWAKDLSTYDAILEWHKYIPFLSNTFGNHLSLFTLLMTVSTIISMRYTNQNASSSQQMPGMQGMTYIMPVMFMFILNKFSAGLTYYYFLTNIISIAQNILFKQFVDEDELLSRLESKKNKPVKKSKFQQRMEALAKQQGYRLPRKK
jgi:YidC/Oxa1 family membrane protein insertase